MTNIFNDNDHLQQNVLLETAQINWHELQYFFARGVVIYVSDQLDLVGVATQVAEDNKDAIEKWMQIGQIAKVTNEQAKEWHSTNALVWAVVVKPWVLVQAAATGDPDRKPPGPGPD